MDILIPRALGALLAPPGLLALVLLVAFGLARRRPRLARALLGAAALALYALSTPFVASRLLARLEPHPADPAADRGGEAIVVLGGGAYSEAPEYGGAALRPETLARLRYAARLQRALGKPVLVAGGAPDARRVPEARLMKEALERDFGVKVRWTEEASRTTIENARASRHLLEPAGVRRVYLVTSAWHMARARLAFEQAGFSVIAAPTGYSERSARSALDFLPDARALRDAGRFFHEGIGLAWYHVRFAWGG